MNAAHVPLGGPLGTQGEDEWVAALSTRWAAGLPPALGIGHDCAVLELGTGVAVVTTDVLVDGVHFLLAECGARRAAFKALAVNLSDLAAAAAEPVAWFLGLVLPRTAAAPMRLELLEGFERAAEHFGVPCAGGDTNVADGPLTLAITMLGRPGPGGVVTRRGARVGDVLSVTGPLGGSLAGRHLEPTPRLREAQVLVRCGIPHAMIDLSDGLSRDLPRLCAASGVGARLQVGCVPIHADVGAPSRAGRSPLEQALDDGEDFELLVAHAPLGPAEREQLEREGVRLTSIGEVVEQTEGIRLSSGATGSVPLVPRGYDHLVSPVGSGA